MAAISLKRYFPLGRQLCRLMRQILCKAGTRDIRALNVGVLAEQAASKPPDATSAATNASARVC